MRILVVEDDQIIREGISEYLSEFGYDIVQAKDGHEALKNFDDREIEDFYKFARDKVNKKSAFASSLLYFEDEENTWKVPNYISEGLLWLREQ